MQYVGEAVTSITMIIIGAMVRGYTLSVLWSWFMVSIFGAPAISIPGAIGILLVAGICSMDLSKKTRELEKPIYLTMAKQLAMTVGFCGVFLLYGWIAKAFM